MNNNYQPIITKVNKAKYSIVLHFVFLCAFLAIFFCSEKNDHVRWNLDAIMFVGSILSAAAWRKLVCHEKSNAFLRYYLRIYSIIGTTAAIVMLIVFWLWLKVKGEKVVDDSDYIIRKVPQGIIMSIDPNLFKLYEKDGIFERYVTTITSDHFRYDMKSVRFHKELSAVSFKLEIVEGWEASDTASPYYIHPIHEEEFNRHLPEIDSLEKVLNPMEEN